MCAVSRLIHFRDKRFQYLYNIEGVDRGVGIPHFPPYPHFPPPFPPTSLPPYPPLPSHKQTIPSPKSEFLISPTL